jgi:hypothetical protein
VADDDPDAAPGGRDPRGEPTGSPAQERPGRRPTAAHPRPRFVADAMLGRLARWLRALGYDTLFDETLDDAALARLAADEGRLLLTRDRRLCEDRGSPDWCLLLSAQRPRAQLRELDRRLTLFRPGWRDRLFDRCMLCNAPLESAGFEEVRPELPPAVRQDPGVRAAGFRRCPECGRVYWEGSHTRRMRRWLEAVAQR